MHMTTVGPSSDAASQDALHAATELLRALASPVRLGIVRELANGGHEAHELVTALGVSQPLVSQHLRVLRTSRIVVGRTMTPPGSLLITGAGRLPARSSSQRAAGHHELPARTAPDDDVEPVDA